MAFNTIILLACVAVVSAGLVPVAQQVHQKTKENDPNPQYSFEYEIQDALSGDSKNQFETRDGNLVRGQYSLNDADGFRRIVDYTADSVNGFNAVVRKEPIGVAIKTVAAAPSTTLLKDAATPIAYSAAAPALLRNTAYTTPVAHGPAVIHSAEQAIVKTSFASPIASYVY